MIADRELTDFVELLQNLNVANNVIRTGAERHYEMLKITPESFLPLKLLSVSTTKDRGRDMMESSREETMSFILLVILI
jgi:hypothetical protein